MNIIPSKELNLEQIRAEEIHFNTMVKRSEILAKSSLLPTALRGKPADVLIIMMMAQELDIPPLQALNGINVIQGKPVVSPQLMIALIRAKVPESYIDIKEEQGKCSCSMSRNKDDKDQIYTSVWTIERAEKMGLALKDNWKKQAGTMLKWRSVGDCARTVFPDILSGLYFPDEFQDGSYEIDEHGELQGKKKEEKSQNEERPKEIVTVVQSSQPSPSYHEFMGKLSIMTNKFQNKELLQSILDQFDIKTSKEILALSENVLLDMSVKLEEIKNDLKL